MREAEHVEKNLTVMPISVSYSKQDTRGKSLFQKHSSKWATKDFKKLGYRSVFDLYSIDGVSNHPQYFLMKLACILPQYPVSILVVKHQLPTKRTFVEVS